MVLLIEALLKSRNLKRRDMMMLIGKRKGGQAALILEALIVETPSRENRMTFREVTSHCH